MSTLNKPNIELDQNKERYLAPFFVQPELQKKIQEEGFAIVDLLSEDILKKLKADTQKLLKEIPTKETFWKFKSVGRIENPEIRKHSNQIIEKHVIPALQPFFQETAMLVPGVHLIKSPSPSSQLNAHQDSALVDEKKYMAVYAWVPLIDTHARNGTLSIIPKSHLLGMNQRSLNVPWELGPFEKELNKYLVPLTVKAGQVVFFDSALIHGSPNNFSLKTRIAVNVFIRPKEADYLHFYMEDMAKGEEVEVYKVSPEFYMEHDISKRPNSNFPLLRKEKKQVIGFSSSNLNQLFT
jgi:ectoine hydroxylase-related dioxygenase (phytanoyl-CoA dioxygenase family)